MKKWPSVTIFVPVKNGEKTLKKCIDSLLKLDYPEKKIWVIDNISDDNTPKILKSYGKKVRWERLPGLVPKLHNYILRNVKTKFLAYTNADCVAERDWLKKLISGFDSDEIVAAAGFFGTPEDVDKLQLLIGREMEERFKKFPKYIRRAPDANLCVRTDVAKKVKFNEKFFWSWESDFGYRLTKLGKMKYIPEAVIYHYHRSTWKGFFRQQLNNAKATPMLLLTKKKEKIMGDHISTPEMGISILLSYIFLGIIFISIFEIGYLKFLLIPFSLLLYTFLKNSIKLSNNISEIFWFLLIFSVRMIAFLIGLPIGFLKLYTLLKKRRV